MSTTAADSTQGKPQDQERPDVLGRHLHAHLQDLWDCWPAPVWVADARGEIVYANPTARNRANGIGLRRAAASIAAAANQPHEGASHDIAAASPGIAVSSLLNGCGQHIGWLAIGLPD